MTCVRDGLHAPTLPRARVGMTTPGRARRGFGWWEIEAVEKVSKAASVDDVAVGLCQGTPMRAEIEARAPGKLDEVTAELAQRLASRYGSSGLSGAMKAYVIMAQ